MSTEIQNRLISIAQRKHRLAVKRLEKYTGIKHLLESLPSGHYHFKGTREKVQEIIELFPEFSKFFIINGHRWPEKVYGRKTKNCWVFNHTGTCTTMYAHRRHDGAISSAWIFRHIGPYIVDRVNVYFKQKANYPEYQRLYELIQDFIGSIKV